MRKFSAVFYLARHRLQDYQRGRLTVISTLVGPRWAIEHNWVSITPLRLDLTDEKDLARALRKVSDEL